jgi:hypothetical protein
MNETSYAPPVADLEAVGRRALNVGLAGAVVCVVGLFVNPPQFFRSYLVAWTLCVGVTLGSFAIEMLHHTSRGAWGLMIRRILEAASRTLPAVGLFGVPLLFGLPHLYPWARPTAVAADELLRHKEPYLNVPFFAGRFVFYFAVWSAFAFTLSRLSKEQDATGDPALERRMQALSAGGLTFYVLSVTFFAVDFLMSLTPRWFSAIYGIYVLGGQIVGGLAFTILVALFLSERPPMNEAFQPIHFHDYGKLLLAFTMLWSYFGVSQLIIIWSGDLPEEIPFYKERMSGAWGGVSLLLVLFHFAVPFALLLSRNLKRDVRRLSLIALLLLAMRWVDLWWLVAPAFHPSGFPLHWLDPVALAALGGVWVWLFTRELKARPLVPFNDPFLPAALEAEARAHG